MAFSYPNTPVLSKIKIGDNYYYVKDADLRSVVDGFNADIVGGELGLVTEQNKLVYSQNIKAYVDAAVSVGLVIVVTDTLPTASADTMGKLYLVGPQTEGKTGDFYDEYVTVSYIEEEVTKYKWEKIGDTRIDLSNYVTNVSYDASTKKLSQTKNGTTTEVHAFGDFADADQGETSVTTVDSAKFSYTPEGSVSVELQDATTSTSISSTGKYTPAGSITGEAIKGGSIAVTVKDAAAATAVTDLTYDNYTPEGSVAAPTLDVQLASKQVQFVDSVGSMPSFTEGAFTPASIDASKFFNAGAKATYSHDGFSGGSLGEATTDKYVKKVQKMEVGTGSDAECLIISEVANTDTNWYQDAVKAQGTYTAAVYGTDTFNGGTLPSIDVAQGFNGGSKAADTWVDGVAPTLKAAEAMVNGLTSATASAPAFTGTAAAVKLSGAKYLKQEINTATFSPEAAVLGFSGSEGDVDVTGSYNKQEIKSAAFTGTALVDKEVTLTKTSKDLVVNPKAE